MKNKWLTECVYLLLVAATGYVFFKVIDAKQAAIPHARDYILQHGTEQTGAINLVTSIYLGYRAFDTLGETIVLFIAVSGTILYLTRNNEKN
ncbi:hypothetical protein QA601_01680 [Chitinispirillales bacterium ANBcel5]|uniref:hydrogen gas-evolving membrane-bound hydrogenase subunit E n=1 Tax=Cellulosispirillum alkaliphilum TaxID=3039283 RepID=UPI002A54A48C|nr:hypothetical protein [Chitinispirillales bacterium ANBcel5]